MIKKKKTSVFLIFFLTSVLGNSTITYSMNYPEEDDDFYQRRGINPNDDRSKEEYIKKMKSMRDIQEAENAFQESQGRRKKHELELREAEARTRGAEADALKAQLGVAAVGTGVVVGTVKVVSDVHDLYQKNQKIKKDNQDAEEEKANKSKAEAEEKRKQEENRKAAEAARLKKEEEDRKAAEEAKRKEEDKTKAETEEARVSLMKLNMSLSSLNAVLHTAEK